MKTFTKEQFIELIENGKWKRTQEIGSPDYYEENDGITTYSGNAWIISSLDGIEICYNEVYTYDEYQPDSFESAPSDMLFECTVEGAIIVDDDGDRLCSADECVLLAQICGDDFCTIDYSTIHKELEQTMDIDKIDDKDDDFFYVQVDYSPDIRFKGERLAFVETNDNNVHPDFSGKTGRWDDWSIYKTKSGKFVCSRIEYTRWSGQTTSYEGKVCENEQEVIDFFGHSKLAKELYDEAGIEDVDDVE